MSNITNKTDSAIKLLRTFAETCTGPVELAYSGGKDSDVILNLARMAGIKFDAIYKNTTIDPPGTISHVLSQGDVRIVNPKYTFLQLVERNGFPTRRARFCCSRLKEYKIHDFAIQGVRRCESVKRMANYSPDDPIICRTYGSKKNHVNIALPILNWTNDDVAEFVTRNNIQCHSQYYDADGQFCANRRLGCMGCPLQSDNGKSDFKLYPMLLRQVAKAGWKWWNNHPQAKSHFNFQNPYELLAHNLFYNSYESWLTATVTLTGRTDWKETLEIYFDINLDFKL